MVLFSEAFLQRFLTCDASSYRAIFPQIEQIIFSRIQWTMSNMLMSSFPITGEAVAKTAECLRTIVAL